MLKGVAPDEAQRHQLMPHQTFCMTVNEQTPIWLARDKYSICNIISLAQHDYRNIMLNLKIHYKSKNTIQLQQNNLLLSC